MNQRRCAPSQPKLHSDHLRETQPSKKLGRTSPPPLHRVLCPCRAGSSRLCFSDVTAALQATCLPINRINWLAIRRTRLGG
eukprot:3980135-Prymnesium_polylepis.1